jgi:hypothetical protein
MEKIGVNSHASQFTGTKWKLISVSSSDGFISVEGNMLEESCYLMEKRNIPAFCWK